jgi:hypothetical protein
VVRGRKTHSLTTKARRTAGKKFSYLRALRELRGEKYTPNQVLNWN